MTITHTLLYEDSLFSRQNMKKKFRKRIENMLNSFLDRKPTYIPKRENENFKYGKRTLQITIQINCEEPNFAEKERARTDCEEITS